MAEVVGTFSRTELGHECADRAVEPANGALSGFAQERFELAVSKLDGIKVRRVFRQISQRGPHLLNGLADAGNLVRREVIGDDNIVALECGDQAVLDIGPKHLPVHGAFDHHRGGHSVAAQGRYEGDRLPLSERNAADQPDTARSTPAKPHQIGAHRSLVDKYQPSGVKHALLPHPAPARADDVPPLPFGGLQAFF